MVGIGLSATILLLCLHHAHQFQLADGEEQQTMEARDQDNHIAVMVFTQSWPVSVCKNWLTVENGTECAYPDDRRWWTIHGIWPRKLNGDYLEYCNRSWVFDPEEIKPIEKELEQAWTQTRKDNPRYELWAHEWLKHGTCSTDLQLFETQYIYFFFGIRLNRRYSLKKMFRRANLFPSDTIKYTLDQFINAVKATTEKIPMISCYVINGVTYLHEMRRSFILRLLDKTASSRKRDVSKWAFLDFSPSSTVCVCVEWKMYGDDIK